MKETGLKILRGVLKILSRLTISRYRPAVVGITGSVGKTSAKLAIAAVLSSVRPVRASAGNFNNELGLPLAILGDWSEIRGIFFWPRVIISALWRIAVKSDYPEILVLEYGVDRPSDMKYLLQIARPDIAVITAIGEVPAHVEFFSGPEEVAREKMKIVESLPVAASAVLNQDDDTVMQAKERTRARVLTFGFGSGSTVQISKFENRAVSGRLASLRSGPAGISFTLGSGGSFVPVEIPGVLGKSQAYAAAAAASVGGIFGMNLVKICEALKNYKPAPHRMALVSGIKQTYIIDDSYNASPASVHAALHVLGDLAARRKIAVLGDMLEIGKYAIEAHERVGRVASKIVDALFVVGPRAKFIAQAAEASGLNKKNIFIYDTASDAKEPLKNFVKSGDLILVKASHAIGLDKIVESLKAI